MLHMNRHFVVAAAAGLLALAGLSRPVAAQEQPLPPFTGSGTLEKAARGVIQIRDAAGDIYFIAINPQTRVSVVGTADPSFLMPSLFVRFSGEFNKQGTAQGEISELSIVELSEVVQPGAQADVPIGEDLKEKEGPIPYVVVGQVRSFKNGKLQVNIPGKSLRVKLSDDAQIDVDVANYSWARPGDEVTVQGRLFQPGKVIGEEVNIKLVEPLEGKKKRGRQVKKESRDADKEKDAEKEKAADKEKAEDDKEKAGDKPADDGQTAPADEKAEGVEASQGGGF